MLPVLTMQWLVEGPPNCVQFRRAEETLQWPIFVIARPDLDAESEALLTTRIRHAGLSGPIRWVPGDTDCSDSTWGALGFLFAESPLSLTLAHLSVMRFIARRYRAAWVFEDDVVLHDHFNSLFPFYWESRKVST